MEARDFFWFVTIVAVIVGAIWVVTNPDYPIRQGLDLQGGLQVLLEADVPAEDVVTDEQMDAARQIISQRINGLGVSEPLVQAGGDRRIVIELPGLDNADEAISLVQETALLEFVNTGANSLPEGMCIRTTENDGAPSRCESAEGAFLGPAEEFETVITGADLQDAQAQSANLVENYVAFTLTEDGGTLFGDYTATHIGQFLTIVLDKQVVSSPQIQAAISRQGTITGNFSPEEAQSLALRLRFGSLPVPLRIEGIRQVGATLGEQSVNASVQAGSIGLIVVLLFMLTYYRLPGFLADIALIIYALAQFCRISSIGCDDDLARYRWLFALDRHGGGCQYFGL